MSVQELEAEARKLPAAERAQLAEALWDSIADEANANPDMLPCPPSSEAREAAELARLEVRPHARADIEAAYAWPSPAPLWCSRSHTTSAIRGAGAGGAEGNINGARAGIPAGVAGR